MPDKQVLSERPHVVPGPLKPVTVFICPCRVDSVKIEELAAQATDQAGQREPGALLELRLEPLGDECLGLRVRIQPRLFFLSDMDWVALALVAEISPASGNFITFEQMLALNSNLRVCQGELERQDTPVVGPQRLEFALSSGRRPVQVFEQTAQRVLGAFRPPDALKRAVTLSIAQFEHVLSDEELYAFGTIAHSDEVIDPDWAAVAIRQRAYDRWHSIGTRFLVHSYSLVCSCTSGQNEGTEELNRLGRIFVKDYAQIGARLALERAQLLELRSALQDIANLDELRRQRKKWVDSRRVLGVRWTAEGTQRAQIEQLWRQASGLEEMSEEVDRRFEQTVGLFEAGAADRLNRLLMWFQMLVVGLGAATVTATVASRYEWDVAVPWTVGIGGLAMGLCWLGLHYGMIKGSGRRRRR